MNSDRMRSIYLNNAATSYPKAPGVAEALCRALSLPAVEPGRAAGTDADPAAACRRSLARLLGVSDPNRLVLTANATHALNLAISGLELSGGAAVVTTVTEHNSALRPLWRLEREGRIRLRLAASQADGRVDEEDYERALDLEPKLVVLNHASNVTGVVQDAPRLLAQAKRAGAVTLLDASQTAGHLKLDLAAADLAAFTGHKGLLGPTGTGALYVAPNVELAPLLVGGTGVRSDLKSQPPEMPVRLEAGTPNTAGLAGLASALEWLHRNAEEHREREQERRRQLVFGLRALPGVRVFGPENGAATTGIVSFRIGGWEVEEAGFAIEESFGIHCRAGLHCAPLIHRAIGAAPDGTIRFSVSGFTTQEEVLAALKAVERLAACAS